MQAVILAAGKGTRMAHLTKDTPKPLINLAGKNLIEHKIDRLPKEIDEVVLVVSYLKDKIIKYFGDSYKGRKITYIDQGEALGSAHALWQARGVLKDDFICMMGDDLYSAELINKIVKSDWALHVIKAKSFATTADIQVDADGNFEDAIFDDIGSREGEILLATAFFKLKKEIFDAPLVSVMRSKELGLPHTVFKYIKDKKLKMKVVEDSRWLKINTPDDLISAEKAIVAGML